MMLKVKENSKKNTEKHGVFYVVKMQEKEGKKGDPASGYYKMRVTIETHSSSVAARYPLNSLVDVELSGTQSLLTDHTDKAAKP